MADELDYDDDSLTTPQQKQAALVAALRGQQRTAAPAELLFAMGQNPVTQPMAKEAIAAAHQQQQLQLQGQQHALAQQLAQQRADEAERHHREQEQGAGKGAAGVFLDPATVIHLRPDVAQALGGEDTVMGMDPRTLAAAVKAYDSKQGMDYRSEALKQRMGAQAHRSDVMDRSVAMREKKLGLDVGGRQVPGMEMEDGYVMQPKEAAAGKTLRGNVQRAMQALNALRTDFTKYGPDRLASYGGIIPSEALTRMEGNRARLLEASLGLQGMNPTIGHQELLQHQLRDPGDFKNINQAAYLAQLSELEKSIHETETAFAAGHGVKKLSPLKQAAQPGEAPASAPTGLTPEQQKRLAELRAKRDAGVLR